MRTAGLGTENLIKVSCNAVGQMLPDALEQALVAAKEQGKVRMAKGSAFTQMNHDPFAVSVVDCIGIVVASLGKLASACKGAALLLGSSGLFGS